MCTAKTISCCWAGSICFSEGGGKKCMLVQNKASSENDLLTVQAYNLSSLLCTYTERSQMRQWLIDQPFSENVSVAYIPVSFYIQLLN